MWPMSSAEIRGYREMDFAGRDDVMNNPLRYQVTEYDCGPTSMLNAISYLFPREEIPPEIVRNINTRAEYAALLEQETEQERNR